MSIFAVDTEYGFHDGLLDHESRWEPVVFCAVNVDTGERTHFWADDPKLREWIIENADATFIAHNAIAEIKYLLRLSIPVPRAWFDTKVVWRYVSNSWHRLPADLTRTLNRNGLEQWVPREKKELQEAIGNLQFDGSDPRELRRIVEYCYADCEAVRVLYYRLKDQVSAALVEHWSDFLVATSRMELRGIQVDAERYRRIRQVWPTLLRTFTDGANAALPGIYDGSTLKLARFIQWCRSQDISWPVKESLTTGKLYYRRDDRAFKDMAIRHPLIARVRETEKAKKAFGKRTMVVDEVAGKHFYGSNTFSTITSRNSNPQFIFGGPKWMRYLIVPPSPDHVIVYVDYVAEEFGIAAALSGDVCMADTYRASDCHMDFAIRSGAAPEGATKETHPVIRKLYKTCNLGTLFGQAARGLAMRLGIELEEAVDILDNHRRLYSRFWDWSESVVEGAYDRGQFNTCIGWRMWVPSDTKYTVLMNWQMQSTGAEIM